MYLGGRTGEKWASPGSEASISHLRTFFQRTPAIISAKNRSRIRIPYFEIEVREN
jgi:hypothetical protein